MPVTLRINQCIFFNQRFLSFQIRYHFFNRNVIIRNCGRFAISFDSIKIKFRNKTGLMRFSSLGNSKWIPEWQVKTAVMNFHCSIELYRYKCATQVKPDSSTNAGFITIFRLLLYALLIRD